MKSKNWIVKIKKLIKERDSRFWLLIFVVISTLAVLVIWSMNIKNIFPKNGLSQDFKDLGLDEIKTEFQEDKDDFSKILEELKSKSEVKNEKKQQDEIEEIRRAINKKIEENNSLNTSSDIFVSTSTVTSSIPVISQDLDESEQEINKLKDKIEELEKRLND